MSEPMSLADFHGKARLFPLPNLVFFPHVMQPLHIFEPRYRAMTQDALDGDRLIALVLPLPGSDCDARPPLHDIACLGRIMAEQRLDDGRFNVLLRGMARLRIRKELDCDKPYRVARCEVLEELPLEDAERERCWRRKLVDKAPGWFPHQTEVVEQFAKLLKSDLAVGTLCDILTFALPLDAEFKQSLLAELDVETRLQVLHDFLECKKTIQETSQRKFPPEFSAN